MVGLLQCIYDDSAKNCGCQRSDNPAITAQFNFPFHFKKFQIAAYNDKDTRFFLCVLDEPVVGIGNSRRINSLRTSSELGV